MSRVLDKEKIQSALDDAAAKSGSRDVQRGDLRVEAGLSDIAVRIRNEIQNAILNWATAEAFNSQIELLQSGLEPKQAWQPAKFAVKALVRDVISALMRVTDSAGDLETLCRFIRETSNLDAQSLSQRTGASDETVRDALRYLRDRVPPNWSNSDVVAALAHRELHEMRTMFKPIRDGLLAHAKDYSQIDLKNDIPKIRSFLKIVSRLSCATCLIANVPSVDFDESWNASFDEATRFWGIVAAGSKNWPKA